MLRHVRMGTPKVESLEPHFEKGVATTGGEDPRIAGGPSGRVLVFLGEVVVHL